MREKILLGLFFIAVFINFLGPIIDPDFPFHLKTGEYIYQHREIPKDDPFSIYGQGILTERERFILSQYWIAQIIFYKLFSTFGPSGIILLRASVFSAFVFLLWFILRKRGLYFSLITASLVTIMLQTSKVDRPQFFSFLFTLILILLLQRYKEKPESTMPLIFIPPLMLLWANMHAGFVFGIAVIVIFSLSEALKSIINKPYLGQPFENKQVLFLLATALIAILVSYLNPDVNGQILEAFESHTKASWLYKENREYISPVREMGVYFGDRVSISLFFSIFAFVSTVTIFNMLRTKSIDITSFSLIIFSSVAAFSAVRYIPFFVAVVIPISKNYRFFRDASFLNKTRGSTVTFSLLLIFFISAIGFGLKRNGNMFSIDKSYYPDAVADFLLTNRMDANIFNHTNKGSYLLWRLYPHYKVFNDTRFIDFDAVVDSDAIAYTLDDYSQPFKLALGNALSDLVPKELGRINVSSDGNNIIRNDKPLWKKLLNKYNINLIVHEACAPFTKELYPLTLRLIKDDEWVLIYLDGTMQIFVRNREKYSNIIKKLKLPKEFIYDEIILETMPLVSKGVPISTPYSSLAFALMMKGKDETAKKMIDAALELDKNDIVAHFCNAYLFLKQKSLNKPAQAHRD